MKNSKQKTNFWKGLNLSDTDNDDISDVISYDPPYLVRNGIFIIFFFFLVTFSICWFVKYPNRITSNVKVIAVNGPEPVQIFFRGKLVKILINEKDRVQQGDILGIVGTTADYRQVIFIKSKIDSLLLLTNKNKKTSLLNFLKPEYTQLGELNNAYRAFIHVLLSLRIYLVKCYATRRGKLPGINFEGSNYLYRKSIPGKDISILDFGQIQTETDHRTSLINKVLVSDGDHQNAGNYFDKAKISDIELDSSATQEEIQLKDLRSELPGYSNYVQFYWIDVRLAALEFERDIEAWCRKHLLIAPISGKISFPTFVSENELVDSNQTFCYVTPENESFYGEMLLPHEDISQINVDQKVVLKFPAYPVETYGYVAGKVQLLREILVDRGIVAKISFANGLITNLNDTIHFQEGLIAKGEIVTKDVSLVQRFFNVSRENK